MILHMKVYVLFFLLMAYVDYLRAEDKPFRVNKHNMIWQKVQNKMSSNKLEKLKHDLLEQDDKHLKWKELKVHGGDADGSLEAKLRRNLLAILENFGVSRFVDRADFVKDREVAGNNIPERNVFGDKRLSQLWELINKQGKFSKDELNELKTEFEHHKEKLDEYQRLLTLLNKQHEISDNSVFVHDRMKDHEMENLKRKLKQRHDTMNDDYMKLKEKVTGERSSREFRDYRVMELWERAKERGFTQNELDSIKEELRHFDHKIQKHEHYKKQVEKSEKLIRQGHKLEHDHDELQKREKEHGKYVKKLHSTLLDRVTDKSEL